MPRAAQSSRVAARRPPKSPKANRDPLKDLAAAIKGSDKQETIDVLRLSDDDAWNHPRAIVSTRSIAVDTALQGGGLACGRIAEIFGKPQTGKTTLRDQVFAEIQSRAGVAVLMDTEEKTDRDYSTKLQVNTADVLLAQMPQKTIEAALDVAGRVADWCLDRTAASWVPICYAWDTVAGTPTIMELVEGKTVPGTAARALRFGFRTLVSRMARAGVLWFIVNQQYEQIGRWSPVPGRVSKTTYGGGGLHYHATTRLELVRTGSLQGAGGREVGITGIVRAYKNSLGAPRDEEYAIQWGKGFSNAWSIFTKLKDHGYITVTGNRYRFGMTGVPEVTWQGNWFGLDALFNEHPEVFKVMAGLYTQLPPYVRKVT